jgi:hypothetical protein
MYKLFNLLNLQVHSIRLQDTVEDFWVTVHLFPWPGVKPLICHGLVFSVEIEWTVIVLSSDDELKYAKREMKISVSLCWCVNLYIIIKGLYVHRILWSKRSVKCLINLGWLHDISHLTAYIRSLFKMRSRSFTLADEIPDSSWTLACAQIDGWISYILLGQTEDLTEIIRHRC